MSEPMTIEEMLTPVTEEEAAIFLNDENMLEEGRNILRRLLFQRDYLAAELRKHLTKDFVDLTDKTGI